MAAIFWDARRMIHIGYLEKRTNKDGHFYAFLFDLCIGRAPVSTPTRWMAKMMELFPHPSRDHASFENFPKTISGRLENVGETLGEVHRAE